ncbi:MAG: hypothetical protein QM784_09665 [Polyangiaceae bacterium]
MTLAEKVQQRDALRLRLLREIYEHTQADPIRQIGLKYVDVGMESGEFESAIGYLDGKGLVEAERLAGLTMLKITSYGIDEIETSIRFPDRETEYFSPVVIKIVNNYFENSTVGVLQQDGSGNSAEVEQSVDKTRRA